MIPIYLNTNKNKRKTLMNFQASRAFQSEIQFEILPSSTQNVYLPLLDILLREVQYLA